MIRLRDKITVLNVAATTDEYGNPTRDWATATATPERAAVRPATTNEVVINEDTVTTRWRVLLAPGTKATYGSRIRWRGLVLEVDGEVQQVADHIARISHCAAYLKRVTG